MGGTLSGVASDRPKLLHPHLQILSISAFANCAASASRFGNGQCSRINETQRAAWFRSFGILRPSIAASGFNASIVSDSSRSVERLNVAATGNSLPIGPIWPEYSPDSYRRYGFRLAPRRKCASDRTVSHFHIDIDMSGRPRRLPAIRQSHQRKACHCKDHKPLQGSIPVKKALNLRIECSRIDIAHAAKKNHIRRQSGK